MPYISEKHRENLDSCVEQLSLCIKQNIETQLNKHIIDSHRQLSNEEFLSIAGDINYCFSRIVGNLMGKVSYPKIAIITGVLENIKQEFYRRVATQYEETKIIQNGDIKEYRNI
jgi:hypothetical protein